MQQPEVFEIFDDTNALVGTEFRDVVHKKGLYHRAVNVMIFDDSDRLLLQKRSPTKDICADRWDLSVSEHLKPEETFRQAAIRGLKEELDICLSDEIPLITKARDCHLSKHDYPQQGKKDYEWNECWFVKYGGAFKIDEVEVVEARWVSLPQVSKLRSESELTLTPWFVEEWDFVAPRLLREGTTAFFRNRNEELSL